MSGQKHPHPGDFVATRADDNLVLFHGRVVDLRAKSPFREADLSNVIPFSRARRLASEPSLPPLTTAPAERPAPPCPRLRRWHELALVVVSILLHSLLLLELWQTPTPLASIGVEAVTLEEVLGADTPAGIAILPSESEVQAVAPAELVKPDDQAVEQQQQLKTTEQRQAVPDETRQQPVVEQREVAPEERRQQQVIEHRQVQPQEMQPQQVTVEQSDLQAQETRQQVTAELRPLQPKETSEQIAAEQRALQPQETRQQQAAAEQREFQPQETRQQQVVPEMRQFTPEETPPERPAEITADKPLTATAPSREPPQEVKPVKTPVQKKANTKQASATPSAPSSASSGVGRGRSDASSNYPGTIVAHLGRHKRYPAAARMRGTQGSGAVTFSIDGNGRVTSATVSKSTGSPMLDDELTAMVQRASPFPPPPGGLSRSFSAPVNFRLR